MTVFKCKMCGGELNITEGESVCVCEYCGTRQTVPSLDNEKKISLFNRANRLRYACEFDKASGVYESIVSEFQEEPEAYWGLVLCKYGIEYVDDPQTGKKIPTCHRSSFDSVMDDPNFDMVMEYSDPISRAVYRSEAKEIERIRSNIIDVSLKEEPYDIFICYKEKDENGERTIDSVMAQDVYDALVKKGYRVFFSRISLEDKLGEDYEPYIFAALNSAKIMLAFGTDYEYFNAVWVKNEWSRFLDMIEKGAKKTLIPCFKDIDVYDIPKEFAHLQAQDMGKVGAVQDLLRGIDKIMGVEKPQKTEANDQINYNNSANTESLLKRAFMFLEDGEWEKADNYCEQVLDIDPETAQAYEGKLLAELHVHTKSELSELGYRFDGYNNYKKAVQFGDTSLIEESEKYNNKIYDQAVSQLASLKTVEESYEVSRMFNEILGWKDSKQKLEECQKKGQILKEQHVAEKRAIIEEKQNEMKIFSKYILCGNNSSVGITPSGRVYAKGYNKQDQLNVNNWTNIVSIVCAGNCTIGLEMDGNVVTRGENSDGQCNVQDWQGIIAIACSGSHTVGLKYDGSVVATGNNDRGQCDVQEWQDIISIACSGSYTVGLKKDGHVVSTGSNNYGQRNVQEWKDIVEIISSEGWRTIGLNGDGSVFAAGQGDFSESDLQNWENIVSVASGEFNLIGLKSDGTVVAAGDNKYGQCNVQGWEDIISIATHKSHTIGLKMDGTVVAAGNNDHGQCDVQEWKDIIAIACGNAHTIGLKRDGTLVATGDNNYYQCLIQSWKLFEENMTAEDVLKQEGTLQQLKQLSVRKGFLNDKVNIMNSSPIVTPAMEKKNSLTNKIKELQVQLENLGAFKGQEKRELKNEIEKLQQEMPDDAQIEMEKNELEKEHQKEMDKYKSEIADLITKIASLKKELSN